MKAVTKILAGGVAAAALLSAAPAAAQYYPGYGGYGGYGNGGNVIGQVLGQVLGNGYGYNGYAPNSQAIVNQCANAVQARLNGGYTGYGASPYGYGANGMGNARVLGISRVEQLAGGGLTVRGVATSGRSYGYAGNQSQVDLTWKCKSDYRGYISDIDVRAAQRSYGQTYQGYQNYQPMPYTGGTTDYSQYGYQRY
jgi:hypothetical protein